MQFDNIYIIYSEVYHLIHSYLGYSYVYMSRWIRQGKSVLPAYIRNFNQRHMEHRIPKEKKFHRNATSMILPFKSGACIVRIS